MNDTITESDDAEFTINLDDQAATEVARTGGKGANLARLRQAGFSVPAGFCITTAAYRTLVADPAIRETIESLENLDPGDIDRIREKSATIREGIVDAAFPERVRQDIETMVGTYGRIGFAVRSSATAEDLPTASFAGQHETYLNVSKEAVLNRIRDCMASLFTERAVTYRLRNDMPSSEIGMAVVLQEMVKPEVSGVLFTAEPVTENRQVSSIEATYGLGETLVSGNVSADTVRVDVESGEILSYDIGEKSILAQSQDHGGIEYVEATDVSNQERTLSEEQIQHLVKVGRDIERQLGEPQDIEWAVQGDELFILQARPITSLFPRVTPRPDDELLHVYLSFGHQQAMPEALPPLVVDFWRSFIDDAAGRFRDPEKGGLTVDAGNRVYIDLTPGVRFGPFRRRLPGFISKLNEPAAQGLRETLGERTEDIPVYDRDEGLVAAFRAIRRGSSFLRAVLPRILSQFMRSLLFGLPAPDKLWEWSRAWGTGHANRIRSPETPEKRVQSAFQGVDLAVFLADVAPRGASVLPGVLAGRLLHRMFPEAPGELDAIGKGFEDEVVTQLNQDLGELADLARNSPEVRDAFAAGATLAELRELPEATRFLEEFDVFLERFGHRATGEIDLSRPRWRDDPSPLLRTIQSNVEHGSEGKHREHLAELQKESARAESELINRAAHGILGPVRKRFVRDLIRSYRKALPIREFPKMGMGHAFAAIHDVLLEAGETLAQEGTLDDPNDVWYLRREELLAGLTGEPVDVAIGPRQRTHEQNKEMTAPPLVTSEGEQPAGRDAQCVGENTLGGTAVSSGVIEGRARVVRDPATASLEPGEILVAPATDPGWTPLFLNAGGLVMEVGGQMTHGALVAREYGIPAVASVTNATDEIQTGERVRVDGSAGTVEFLERTEEE